MFYDTQSNAHGMAHDPFKAIVSPRPIGWIGSKGRDGSYNLAPYSFFTAISDKPKMVMFSSTGRKDSLRNIEETGCFTANFVSHDLGAAMNASSVPAGYGVSEFDLAGLTPAIGRLVEAPYVDEAYAVLECKATDVISPKTLSGEACENLVVFGEVVGIHIADSAMRDGRFDVTLVQPLARLGYMDYAVVTEVFQMKRPSKV
ncbi:flavin reductase (DIM6/NTAB) family NADH-FMN oxidoreductase RutF [Agrobacterium vitis]|nr:flavin reductase (DIM6/NTAB) family NADH-FMN oxidoreductase RutF [Agrobacterium vitis]MBE1437609.1 flavin reductase (DIM6/NTAB) family NADH-FMN oxidoreductase RutF [Agrobacterium vitis]